MFRCAACGNPLGSSPAEVPEVCGRCGQPTIAPEESPAWTSIARVRSLAEVGFFEDVLSRGEIDCRVHERDDFSAVDGTWEKTFVIQVPETAAAQAVERLQGEVEDENSTAVETWQVEPAAGSGPAIWKPLALVLVAGGLVYLASRSEPVVMQNRQERPDPTSSLWDSLTEMHEPLESVGPAGETRSTLRYDAERERLILEVDTNGDGELDLRREFSEGRLVHESTR